MIARPFRRKSQIEYLPDIWSMSTISGGEFTPLTSLVQFHGEGRKVVIEAGVLGQWVSLNKILSFI